MTALSIERKTPKLGQDVLPSYIENVQYGIAASTKIFAGAITCLATQGANAGYLVQGTATTGLVPLGIAQVTYDNSTGAAGALLIGNANYPPPRAGCFLLNNSTGVDLIAQVNVGQPCYIADDNTVALTNGGGTRSFCGIVAGVDAAGSTLNFQPGGVWVQIGIVGYNPLLAGSALPGYLDMSHQARCATLAALPAYTASTSTGVNVLTANANGALTIDGVAVAIGDRILLTLGAAGSDNGIYVVTNPGAAGAKFVLTRAPDWSTGSLGLSGTVVEVSEGTVYAQSTWKVTTAGGFTVDTTSIALYPRIITQPVTLVAGTVTVANVPVLSATKTSIAFDRTTPNTTASTIAYNTTTLTPGAVGTASVVFQAQVAAGTINSADISTGNLSIINW